MANIIQQHRAGFLLAIDSVTKSVISIKNKKGVTVAINQRVSASGLRLVKKGTVGVVKNIYIPNTGIRTDDVIRVHFEGLPTSTAVRFDDLVFTPL